MPGCYIKADGGSLSKLRRYWPQVCQFGCESRLLTKKKSRLPSRFLWCTPTENVWPYPFSLACVNKHKKKTGCTGERSKTVFVSKGNFDNIQLLSGKCTMNRDFFWDSCSFYDCKWDLGLQYLKEDSINFPPISTRFTSWKNSASQTQKGYS